jgi:hypothetical protein
LRRSGDEGQRLCRSGETAGQAHVSRIVAGLRDPPKSYMYYDI